MQVPLILLKFVLQISLLDITTRRLYYKFEVVASSRHLAWASSGFQTILKLGCWGLACFGINGHSQVSISFFQTCDKELKKSVSGQDRLFRDLLLPKRPSQDANKSYYHFWYPIRPTLDSEPEIALYDALLAKVCIFTMVSLRWSIVTVKSLA